ncbi:hypothetical protein TSTA_062420 [Talaromyces stipitatus ATCC 10500]|uniref:Integrase catalytic domain-containing protein n=1 Tax=Talaromyces stipitatus (strain ATCC 10500 / CBS 375.48 / QM 6759 / NRRL 1006) TaxID=441959 RepID=B8LXU0_TALSN|nr:uncharacterized protein TSTA_062420 [Talaromyces stipitatus ATCC 10500]EED22755.1 hypothetical protein TSTA_062420 [Talaromyces stipitatus ATCC 10500]
MDEKKTTVILKTSDDWRKWMEQLRTKATKEQVWEYMNPSTINTGDLEPAPTKPIEPIQPSKPDLSSDEDIAIKQFKLMNWQADMAAHDSQRRIYEHNKARYEKHIERMTNVKNYILDTVELGHQSEIRQMEDIKEIIRTLKRRFALTEQRENDLLLSRERSLLNPKRTQRPKEWAEKWRTLVLDMKLANFYELSDTRLARDFIQSTAEIAPKFHDIWSTRILEYDMGLDTSGLTEIPDINEIIGTFDKWVEANNKLESSHRRDIAMATLNGKSDQPEDNKKSQMRSKSKDKTCLCGQKHQFEDCPYVNPAKRPKDWESDISIEEKFKNLEKKDTPYANALKRVKKGLEKKKKERDSDTSKKTDKDSERSNFMYDSDEIACAVRLDTALLASNDDLTNKVIMDNGTTTHIFNDRRRLRNLGNESRWLLVGNTRIKMTGPGETIVYPTQPISEKVKRKGIIVRDAYQELCHIRREGNLYLIEWDENKPARSSLSVDFAFNSMEKNILKDPMNVWHKRFGHVSSRAIEKLQEATEGAIVMSVPSHNNEGFKIKCETCELTTAKRQISRVAMPLPTRPFQKIFVDIIVMNLARNFDRYILHAVDPLTKFHVLVTTTTKSVNFDLERLIEDIEHTFKCVIETIHVDGESSINGNDFKDYCKRKRKTLVTTVPDTPEQNGLSEKAGDIIATRARSMIIEANLPEGLWPEAARAAVHIMNRTPTKSLNYKTLYESVYGKKPYVGNLFLFGSKTYVRIDTKKSHKVAPRAQIGYLVGYEAHNIWLIWTTGPRGTKVIRARDVVFDETKRYDPEHPFAREIIRDSVTTITESLEILNLEDIDKDNQVFDSVDDDMRLQRWQPASIRFSPARGSNECSNQPDTETPVQIEAPITGIGNIEA